MADDRTIVVERGGGGGATAIVAIVVILLLAVGAWYFLLGPGAAGTGEQGGDTDINVNLPSVEVPAGS